MSPRMLPSLCVALAVWCLASTPGWAQGVFLDESNSDTIRVGNDSYEVALLKGSGKIAEILDTSTGEVVSPGTQQLWRATFSSAVLSSQDYTDSGQDTVRYTCDADQEKLVFSYVPDNAASQKLTVQAAIILSDDGYFDLQVTVENLFGDQLDR